MPDEAKSGSFQEDLSEQSNSGGKRRRVKAVWRKIFRRSPEEPTAEQLAATAAAEAAEEAAAVAEIMAKEAEEMLALKLDAALDSGLKVSTREDVTA